jgi:plasmid stability protein
MATLYVENVPDDRYEALRAQAQRAGRSIAAEVNDILQRNVPTEAELQERRVWFEKLKELHANHSSTGKFPPAEEMIREDRDR